MILGTFRSSAPRVTLTLLGAAGRAEVEFVIDTGYTGTLTLPSSLLSVVGAALEGVRVIQLADGTQRRAPFYGVRIDWDGRLESVRATLLDDEPLIGIGLLREHYLHFEVTEGGSVRAEPLQNP